MSMSPRQAVAQNIGDTCVLLGLNDSYGVIVDRAMENGKNFWVVMFARAGTLDGVVHVCSPHFILVKWRGASRDLPHQGSEKCTSEDGAKRFIMTHFGNL